MNTGERLKYLRKEHLHLTADKFGSALGVSQSAISNIENGNRFLTEQMAKSICREYGVREEWLREGVGEPFGAQTRNQKILAFANQVMADEDESFRKCLVEMLSELNISDWEVLEKIAQGTLKKMVKEKD